MLSIHPTQFTTKNLWITVDPVRIRRYWKDCPVAVHLEGTNRILLGEVRDIRERQILVRVERVTTIPVNVETAA